MCAAPVTNVRGKDYVQRREEKRIEGQTIESHCSLCFISAYTETRYDITLLALSCGCGPKLRPRGLCLPHLSFPFSPRSLNLSTLSSFLFIFFLLFLPCSLPLRTLLPSCIPHLVLLLLCSMRNLKLSPSLSTLSIDFFLLPSFLSLPSRMPSHLDHSSSSTSSASLPLCAGS